DYLVDQALKAFDEHTWLTTRHRKDIKKGHRVFLWRCGPDAALVGKGTVLSDPAFIETDPRERRFERRPAKFDGKHWRVKLRTERFAAPIGKISLLKDSQLKAWTVLRGLQGTNFRISAEIECSLERITSAET